MNKISIVLFAAVLSVAAQGINLTGKVTDASNSSPLASVIVTLKNRPLVIDTTGADGTYQLVSSTGVVHFSTRAESFSPARLNKSMLAIGFSQRGAVPAGAYSLNGVLNTRSRHITTPGLYLFSTGSSFTNSNGAGLAKIAAFTDTLIFTSTGFIKTKIALTASTGVNNAAMQPLQANTVADFDGNVYHTVKIGVLIWMVENFKATHYSNGDPIPNVTDNSQWSKLTTGAYCNYNNDTNNVNTYGRLYNNYVISDTRNLAPTGWHVATKDEGDGLSNSFGGEGVAGLCLRESGTAHWQAPNTGATNSSGFTGLPGGERKIDGTFGDIKLLGNWWTPILGGGAVSAWHQLVYDNAAFIHGWNNPLTLGYSVRCVKD
jgi:uncharacterized protein (TIGR02145 family)